MEKPQWQGRLTMAQLLIIRELTWNALVPIRIQISDVDPPIAILDFVLAYEPAPTQTVTIFADGNWKGGEPDEDR